MNSNVKLAQSAKKVSLLIFYLPPLFHTTIGTSKIASNIATTHHYANGSILLARPATLNLNNI